MMREAHANKSAGAALVLAKKSCLCVRLLHLRVDTPREQGGLVFLFRHAPGAARRRGRGRRREGGRGVGWWDDSFKA